MIIISIIICTYNRSELLNDCLQSLVNQTADKSLYEVVVIDNNSTDGTLQTAESFRDKFVHFKVVTETKQGLSHARNRGWQEASAEWVSYLDDDAKARPDNISRILMHIQSGQFDCFGGRPEPWFKYGKPKWYKDSYHYDCVPRNLHPFGLLNNNGFYLLGCAFFTTTKTSLSTIGGFPSHLGMKGLQMAYGEETYVQIKMLELKYRIGYDPDLIIEHLVRQSKKNPWYFVIIAYKKGEVVWLDNPLTKKVMLKHLILSAVYFFQDFGSSLLNFLKKKNFYWQNLIVDGLWRSSNSFGSFIFAVQVFLVKKNYEKF